MYIYVYIHIYRRKVKINNNNNNNIENNYYNRVPGAAGVGEGWCGWVGGWGGVWGVEKERFQQSASTHARAGEKETPNILNVGKMTNIEN